MDDNEDITVHESPRPRWENMVESPILEPSNKYKLRLKYGGYFKLVKNSRRRRYCFGWQKCIYIDTYLYTLGDLIEEVRNRYPSKSDLLFSILFVDKHASDQSFIELNTDEIFMAMLNMYEDKKEVTLYVTTTNTDHGAKERQHRGQEEVIDGLHDEDDSDICPSEESYHSRHCSDNEDEQLNNDGENYSNAKRAPTMKINSTFQTVVAFRRALNHLALTQEFEYFIQKSEPTRFTARCANIRCEWRIHASIMQDNVTFEVRKLIDSHSCTRSNKGGNRRATQGWIASVITDKLKSDGDVTVAELSKWLMKNYNVELPYHKIYRGKEQAYTDMYGNWEDSFLQIDEYKEELRNRNPGSIVEIECERKGDKKCFQRFFISLAACSKGFLAGCRPYISLDGCHLKGKFNGVLVAATAIDGNNFIYPVAYGVLESENAKSWTWFLESLKKAIGMPEGLVISSDMQKGLEVAIMKIYPGVEHRECIRHLCSNFKKHFRGDFFSSKLYGAAITYSVSEHGKLLNEISSKREDAIIYLNENHNKVWSRCKFGTTAKCDYITNNISETFNSWIGELRYQPVLDLLDSIREKFMVRFDKKRTLVKKWKGTLVPNAQNHLRRILKNLGGYEVCKSSDNRAEVKYKGKRWEVKINERYCSCRVWQVTGLPCVHAVVFIAFMRDNNWDKYVDPYFTIEKFQKAYALEISPIPTKDEWVHIVTSEKIHPPVIKRPPGRPRKNRIKAHDEPKRRQKCRRCNEYGHQERTCKNSAPQAPQTSHQYQASNNKRGPGNNSKATRSKKSKSSHCDRN